MVYLLLLAEEASCPDLQHRNVLSSPDCGCCLGFETCLCARHPALNLISLFLVEGRLFYRSQVPAVEDPTPHSRHLHRLLMSRGLLAHMDSRLWEVLALAGALHRDCLDSEAQVTDRGLGFDLDAEEAHGHMGLLWEGPQWLVFYCGRCEAQSHSCSHLRWKLQDCFAEGTGRWRKGCCPHRDWSRTDSMEAR